MLDVTRLRVLAAVARHGSVTAAARALNYAQPSISHHIARLEAETGTSLLQRAGRGVRLTDAGRLLAERAAEIIGRLDAAEAELAAHVGERERRVRVAAFAAALGTIVAAAATALQPESQGIDLMLTEAEPPEALSMLRAGSVDVALISRYYQHDAGRGPAGSGEEGVRGRLLLDEPVYLVTPAAGPCRSALRQGPPDLAAYAECRWIAGCTHCRAWMLSRCAVAGFTPKIAFSTDDCVAVQALVAAGLGVTTLPGLALRAARHPGIRAVPLPGARWAVFAMTYGDPPDPPASLRFIEALAQAAETEPAARAEPAAPP
jgi:DNA-binding transcriptional LysR family regulator